MEMIAHPSGRHAIRMTWPYGQAMSDKVRDRLGMAAKQDGWNSTDVSRHLITNDIKGRLLSASNRGSVENAFFLFFNKPSFCPRSMGPLGQEQRRRL